MAHSSFPHVLCALILIARVGDVVSTWLITPTMRLEANPVMKKLGWRFAIVSLLACLLPYYSTSLAVMALVMFCLVCFWNFSQVWVRATAGEVESEARLLALARKSTLSKALIPLYVAQGFLALVGLLLVWLGEGFDHWAPWIGLGVLVQAGGFAIFGTTFLARLFRQARISTDEGWPRA
jgi:hypothetical protein